MFISLCALTNAEEAKEVRIPSLREISVLINNGLYKNEDEIYTLSSELTQQQKNILYDRFEQKPITPFLVNLLLGFGIGSYIQGDIKGGVISTAGDAVTGITYLIWLGNYSSDYSWYAESKLRTDYMAESEIERAEESLNTASTWVFVSGSALLGFRIFECIRPFFYAKKYNETLTDALGVYDINISILPVVNEQNNNQVALSLKVDY